MKSDFEVGPFDEEERDDLRDTLPETPQDPDDTRDPGDGESDPPDFR